MLHLLQSRRRLCTPLRQVIKRYEINGLREDLPWRIDFDPYFALTPNVRRMAQHAFTELLNNAIDHSGGTAATVSMRQTPLQLQLLVSDDGCGLFNRIEQSFAIADPTLAMLELSKGKLTSNPERHSGYGLFVTSRLADVFDIHANESAFQCLSWSTGGLGPSGSLDPPQDPARHGVALASRADARRPATMVKNVNEQAPSTPRPLAPPSRGLLDGRQRLRPARGRECGERHHSHLPSRP
jgi:anti-sigma regulatory factor (Ser/Thr protein kinase)